jgi:flagellar basal-body rod modification protein FlgD
MFLKLLVAQMKYQDPMNPTDSADFLSQSAQFTALEKMQSVSDQTGMLLGAQMAFGASGLVGRTVTYTLADGTEGAGIVHGVTFGEQGPVLQVGDVDVPIANVVTVTDGATPVAVSAA